MPSESASSIEPIETDAPTRSDQLIELAKRTRGRFSLQYMFVVLLLVSIAFAVLRAMGILDQWEDYYWTFVGFAYFFAPMLCLLLASWLWPRRTGHYKVAAAGWVVVVSVVWVSLLSSRLPSTEIIAVVVAGLVMWGLQVACIATVRWSLFRGNNLRRRLPDRLFDESDDACHD